MAFRGTEKFLTSLEKGQIVDSTTIVWIVIGVAVLLVIIAVIYAVTRNNDDSNARGTGRPRGRQGIGTDRARTQTTTRVETDSQPGQQVRREEVRREDTGQDSDLRPRGRRRRRPPS